LLVECLLAIVRDAVPKLAAQDMNRIDGQRVDRPPYW